MRSRLLILNFIIFLATAAIILRLFTLQVLSFELYKNLAENQHQVFKKLVPQRGQIFVTEGRNHTLVPVVTNIEKNLVYAVPQEALDLEKTAAFLARVLEMPKAEILAKFSDPRRKWVAIKKELSESVSASIQNAKFPGIYLQPESYRFYPEKNFASQVLGFLGYRGDERAGQYGIEEYFDPLLAGKPGSLSLEKDVGGRWITSTGRDLVPAFDGADITLTLDRAIEHKAESILRDAVQRHGADEGSLIVLEPATGRIMAMANFPDFDPNEFAKAPDPSVFRNQAAAEAYEPGSVFKAMTMGAGLDHGVITPDMTFVDTGSVALDKFVIKNSVNKVFGVQTMTQVLEQSINTGAIFAEAKTGPANFLETVKKFGYGRTTGITLPAESPGDIRNLENGGLIHYATASFGQGITVTTLQLAIAYAAIANGGKLMKPQIVDSINFSDGKTQKFEPQEEDRAISDKTANTLGAMLVSVVENGHGKRAGVKGYYVAGKTGTAQVASPAGGYDPHLTIGTFVGFAPVENPKFVIVVKINNPKDVRFAESTAAPAFGEMANFLLNYYQIPPTR